MPSDSAVQPAMSRAGGEPAVAVNRVFSQSNALSRWSVAVAALAVAAVAAAVTEKSPRAVRGFWEDAPSSLCMRDMVFSRRLRQTVNICSQTLPHEDHSSRIIPELVGDKVALLLQCRITKRT